MLIASLALFVVVSPPLTLASSSGPAVQSIRFTTSATPPVYVIPKSLREHEAVFRSGLERLPESLLVVGALIAGSAELDLSAEQAASLTPLLFHAYSKIEADGAFRETPSALSYCFSTRKHTTGHYFLYRPEKTPTQPLCIVFLHGYGGNFKFYTWVLKEEFPGAILLVPSWGVSWHRGSITYLKAMLADAEQRLGIRLRKPWLMAISAGGRGGFSIYNHMPTTFAGYVCLASAPETPVARTLRQNLRILMLNGTTDAMVPIGLARKQADLARQAVPTLRMEEIEGDHFFLLSNRKETFGTIGRFVGAGGDRQATDGTTRAKVGR